MSIIEALVLGLVQGLTEFLPISSSAHLRVVPTLIGWADPGAAYSAVIQLGSVIAVISYFWPDLMKLAGGSIQAIKEGKFDTHEVRVVGGILIGTLPICILGLLLKPMLEQDDSPLRSLNVIGIASIVMGLFLFLAEKLDKQSRTMEQIGARDGLLVGLGQCLALIPGCSRSGSTLTVALLLGIKREDAAKFSFLLGIPAIALSGLLELKHLLSAGLTSDSAMTLVAGFAVSLVVSYAAIAWLLRYLKNHSTIVFVIYRVLFGLVTLYTAMHAAH
jgi:undecaprenyl-diphosphatase